MKPPFAVLLACGLLAFACTGKKEESAPASDPSAAPAAPAPAPMPMPAQPEPAAAPAAPEPTTPAEIELARKTAMMERRDADVIKYCEMAGIVKSTGDGQAALGCAIAACRLGQAEKAKAWAKDLPKALKTQANQICMANKVVL